MVYGRSLELDLRPNSARLRSSASQHSPASLCLRFPGPAMSQRVRNPPIPAGPRAGLEGHRLRRALAPLEHRRRWYEHNACLAEANRLALLPPNALLRATPFRADAGPEG